MLVRPMLLHRMALVSVRLFCKNLGNLQEFFGQMVYRPPWQKIARTPISMMHDFRQSLEAVGLPQVSKMLRQLTGQISAYYSSSKIRKTPLRLFRPDQGRHAVLTVLKD